MRRILPLTVLLSLGACQTLADAGTGAATVNLGDPDTRAAVTQALARAVGRARVELGPTDKPDTAVITVLPPRPGPYETNSLAMPVRFDIGRRDGECVAVRHDNGQIAPLPGVACHSGQ